MAAHRRRHDPVVDQLLPLHHPAGHARDGRAAVDRYTQRLAMQKVLIVEDQPGVASALRVLFDLHGVPSAVADNPDAAVRIVERGEAGVVLQDMNFTPGTTSGDEGIALFRRMRVIDPELPILLMTAWTSLQTAVQLVKEGAADYMAKPWDDAKLVATVRALLRARELRDDEERERRERVQTRKALARKHDLRGTVYESESMHRVVSLAVQIAPSDVPILITGPNGAGKEKIAEIIHAGSRRRDKPLIKINAGAIPDELVESELFGAEAGAYTGSTRLRIGRFEAANGGTLFLDEIGNLSAAGQMKLLRVLQSGEFERLGSSATRKVDVRILSATNADLRKEIAAGRFREDLFFRLNVIELKLPPLSERPDDIAPLAETFLAQHSNGGASFKLAENVATSLAQYDWPGNVRELQNRIHRATLVCKDGIVRTQDLALPAAGEPEPAIPAGPRAAGPERGDIEAALLQAKGVVAKAAAGLGMSRQALYRRMERVGVVL